MKKSIVKLLCPALLLCLSGCLGYDEPTDKVKEIRMAVSEETGITYHWGDALREFPVECMMIKEQGESEWRPLDIGMIEGFVYEKGHAYELRVRKTILANPPADDSNCRYSLVKVLTDTSLK